MGSRAGISLTPSRVIDGVGANVASAGDVNGDGFGDLVVGAHRASPGGRAEAGTVSVFLGSPSGLGPTPALVLQGEAAGDWFGYSVAGAGDVNGDGFADVIVGAYLADLGSAAAGAASVFHGSASGVGPVAARVYSGAAGGDWFGYSVAGAGDVNGDGFADVIVGAYGADPRGVAGAGTSSVFHGASSGLGAAPARVIEGAAGSESGWSVAGAGDVNGDGFADVIVATPWSDSGMLLDSGSASVFHGSSAGLGATASRVFNGARGSQFGYNVAGAGDINGDGFADIVVGADFASPGGRVGAGSASVFLGAAAGVGGAMRVLDGAAEGDRFGRSVSGAGDVDGDGMADLLVGAERADPGGRVDAGTVTVFHFDGAITIVRTTRVLEGTSSNGFFGSAVAGRARWGRERGALVVNAARSRANQQRSAVQGRRAGVSVDLHELAQEASRAVESRPSTK